MKSFLIVVLVSLLPSIIFVALRVWQTDFSANDPERDELEPMA